MAVRLSIIVPTPDGDGLEALFASMQGQLWEGDEVLVVRDTFEGGMVPIPDIAGLRVLDHDVGHHCWGHCQINAGMAHATGDYLVFIDDDDTFTPGALDAIRRAINHQPEPRPLMFRFYAARLGRTLPERYEVVESAIGGHCIVVPNMPERLGQWGERYGGDFDFIASTLALWPDGPAWYDDVIAHAR